MNCGCKILTGAERDTYVIKFCPLHASATLLRDAAEHVLPLLDMLIPTTQGERRGSVRDLLVTALAASRGEKP